MHTILEADTDQRVTVEAIERLTAQRKALVNELGKVIVGQREVIDNVLLTIFCGGHSLVMGVPGLAKTLLVRSLGRVLDMTFSRIQFTPDLMPADITGTDIIQDDPETGRRKVEFLKGPIFANLILADEINRTPPKTQAAMLQVMQEREVTVGNTTYPLPQPFHVFATQNPIEMEGTYVLPEAQADRFMFNIITRYPSQEEEEQVVMNTTGTAMPELKPVLSAAEVVEIQKLVRAVPVSTEVVRYAVRLVSRTRPDDPAAPRYIKEFVRWGASPRASQYLILGAKARAAVSGKLCADYEGVRSVARQVLSHRILTNFNARAQKVTVPELIEKLLGDVKP
ncbi:MoxR family ATPase [Fontisphaera persica]|uniref:AAA family ATPase n=1 Tax=Fontisphaera persica TaxID=2974023 RepID=UPI0024C0D549|nr:MoxR family ATPase [Fontisphaera persica]WCJ60484.1 MoxR family ATPase [Fontisphaera persica]